MTPDPTNTHDLLAAIGFKEREIPIVEAFADRVQMTVPQLLKHSVRVYQVSVEPPPPCGHPGCMNAE